MLVWAKGRRAIRVKMANYVMPLDDFIEYVRDHHITRTPGTAVYLSASPWDTPPILLHHAQLTGQLKEHIVLFTAITDPIPYVDSEKRLIVKVLDNGAIRVIARYGFAESPNIAVVMRELESLNQVPHAQDAVFFMGHETLVTHTKPGLWKHFYSFMARNSMSPALYFRVPPERVIEIGIQVEL